MRKRFTAKQYGLFMLRYIGVRLRFLEPGDEFLQAELQNSSPRLQIKQQLEVFVRLYLKFE